MPYKAYESERTVLKHRKFFYAAAIILAGTIFFLSSMTSDSFPKNTGNLSYVVHFCEYLLLSALLVLAIYKPSRKIWQVMLISVAIAAVYGASDEIHQLFVPGRHCDIFDWFTDVGGAIAGAGLSICVIKHLPARAFADTALPEPEPADTV